MAGEKKPKQPLTFPFLRGLFLAALATALSVLVFAYFFHINFISEALEISAKATAAATGRAVPPTAVPVILLALWAVVERANAHVVIENEDLAKNLRRFDIIRSLVVFALLIWTLIHVSTTSNDAFLFWVAVSFLVVSAADVLMNGRHRLEGGVDRAAAELNEAFGAAVPDTAEPLIDIRPRFRIVASDGTDFKFPYSQQLTNAFVRAARSGLFRPKPEAVQGPVIDHDGNHS